MAEPLQSASHESRRNSELSPFCVCRRAALFALAVQRRLFFEVPCYDEVK
jgi:hypothetical protein